MERFLVHGEGDLHSQPYRLMPWHREFLWRWYELDPADPTGWWWLEALVGAEAGACKTEFFAALAMLEFAGPAEFRRLTPIITMMASSFDQARQLFGQAQIMAGGTEAAPVTAAPLHGMFSVYEREILYADGQPGRIQRVAARAGTAEGGKETLLLADEIHELTGNTSRVYTVRAKSLTKRTPHPGRVCGMSTAAAGKGATPALDSDPLLWRLVDRGRAQQGDPKSRYLCEWLEAPEWVEGSRNDPAKLEQALRMMRAPDVGWSVDVRLNEILTRKIPWNEALRYYFNRFVDLAVDSWLHEIPGCWDECADPNAVPADGSEVVVGVDMALHQDHVGVVVAGRLPDGRVGWWPRSWEPDANGRIDHLDVVSTIAGSIAQRWKIRAVVYDPRFFELPARLLEDQGFLAIEFPQVHERLVPADGLVFNMVRDHTLAHPDDRILNAHVAAATWRESDRGRFFSKTRSVGKMDLLRAGSMATWELLAGDAPEPPAAPAAAPAGDPGDVFRPTGRLDL